MCGLVGYINLGKKVTLAHTTEKMMGALLYFDVFRGPHSTGLASVSIMQKVKTVKEAVPSHEFLELKEPDDMLRLNASTRAMIGHNRWATKGAVNADNAHPFTHDACTLTHNGTLDSMVGLSGTYPTDSERICKTISEQLTVEDVIKVIEGLVGAYALVWYDSVDNTMNFARNVERELYYCYSEDKSTMYYASEPWMLVAAAAKVKTKITKPVMFAEGNWIELDMDAADFDVASHTMHAFTPAPPVPVVASYKNNWGYGAYDDDEWYGKQKPDSTLTKMLLVQGDYVLMRVSEVVEEPVLPRVQLRAV